jgi:hypothetical protein
MIADQNNKPTYYTTWVEDNNSGSLCVSFPMNNPNSWESLQLSCRFLVRVIRIFSLAHIRVLYCMLFVGRITQAVQYLAR